ncbi:MBL fold metallo-hydrolase [Synergistaceae bacterium OttesenSCG-928-D05]|nr:MBL fold metallo-hydrolase [Synergistaceae bacterium OttesenSCG-928-D05]
MLNKVYQVKMGSHSAWLYGQPGHWMLIDAGTRRAEPVLQERLQALECTVAELALIVLTHSHYDHVGAVSTLLKRAKIPVMIHECEKEVVKSGSFNMPDGFTFWSKAFAYGVRHFVPFFLVSYQPFEANVFVKEETRLESYGFHAAAVPTPGHAAGCISVLTDDGLLFAGDLAVNRPYYGIWKHMSPFGDSQEEIKKQWRALIDRGAKTVYPGHGDPFPVKALVQYL